MKKSDFIPLFVRLNSSQNITEGSSSDMLLSQICSWKDCTVKAPILKNRSLQQKEASLSKSHIYFYLNKSFHKIPSINKFD